MKLSIITVNLNNRDGLKKTIDSVISQTYRDFEWIIIDGSSTDGSRELIEEYADYLSYWVSESDSGIYNGMNKGIRASNGEYLLFLNSGDALCNKDVLEKVVIRLKGRDMYVGDFMAEYGISKLDLSTAQSTVYTLLKDGFLHQSIFYHRNVFEKIGYYREDFRTCSDWILNIKAIILYNMTIEKLPFIVSIFEHGGISTCRAAVSEDLKKLVDENKNLSDIFTFYVKYFVLIEKVRQNRLLHAIGLWYAIKKKWL